MAAPQVECILFGAIGSIAHCCEVQWRCFNQALQELVVSGDLKAPDSSSKDADGNTISWDQDSYRASLTSTGGRNRLRAFLLSKSMISESDDEKVTEDLIKQIHLRKTELFVKAIEDGGLKLRPGVKELCAGARASGIKTAFCTLTEVPIVEAFVKKLELKGLFDLVLSEADSHKWGGKAKPHPDCYQYAVRTLLGEGADASEQMKNVVAFEDTQISLQSPVAAGINCIAVPNEWSTDQDFSSAKLCLKEVDGLSSEAGSEFPAKAIAKLSAFLSEN